MTRRVYRATAHYPDEQISRHFLTKQARDRWADRRLVGYEEEPVGPFASGGRPAIPPADRVELATSDPVRFPDDEAIP